MSKKTKIWLRAACIRSIKTMAQTFTATIGSAAVLSQVDWKLVVSGTILAGILSIATSLAGLPEMRQNEVE